MQQMIYPRSDLTGWNWVLWDEVQQDIIRGEEGSGLEWATREEAEEALKTIPQYADYAPQEILPGNTIPDVFAAYRKIPPTVVIAGAGPSLSEGLDRVAEGEYVIALNSAINYPFPYSHWIAFDHRVVDYPWWSTLQVPKGCKILFGARLCNRLKMTGEKRHKPDHYFTYMPPVDATTKPADYLREGLLRGGMNVLGVALQFAYHFGASRVLLTGCDQWGPGHWDGFQNPDPYGSHALHWREIRRLTDLVAQMNKGGVTVQTLTDSAIAGVERI